MINILRFPWFIYGVNSSYGSGNPGNINSTGGTSSHDHSVNLSGNTAYETWDNTKVGVNHGSNMGAHYHSFTISGNTASGSNLPPYYVLAYIIKL